MLLASHTPDLMDTVDALPHEPFNAAARVSLAYQRFAVAIIRDNAHAEAVGATVCNAYLNPDGRETGDRIKTYPTRMDASQLAARVDRIMTLARLAARTDDIGRAKIEPTMRAAMAALGSMDIDLWNVWQDKSKAHMSGPDAAVLDIDGFAHTASRKGHTTEIRYREDAQAYTRSGKAMHASGIAEGVLSENDIAEIMEEIG